MESADPHIGGAECAVICHGKLGVVHHQTEIVVRTADFDALFLCDSAVFCRQYRQHPVPFPDIGGTQNNAACIEYG